MQPPGPDGALVAGRYRLGGRLGRGGMADVFDAYDERLARPVAVKLLRPELSIDPGMRARFEREARAAARLNHASVVAVYDSGEDDGRAFLVMERLPGETLADRMRAGPVDPGWLRGVAVDVCAALQAAHERGLVHRDVKPANVLLDPDGHAKVGDFGIAKAVRDVDSRTDPGAQDLTAAGMLVGTVAYLAPEVIQGSPATPQSDVYALGVVLYEALAGRKPFLGDEPVAQARAAVEGAAPDIATLRPDVPPDLAAVVRRAMSRRPEERFASAADMRAALLGEAAPTAVLGATQVLPPASVDRTRVAAAYGATAEAARPDPAGPPPTTTSGGGRRALVALLVVLVVAAAVAAVLLATRRHPVRAATPTTTSSTTTSTPTPASTSVPAIVANLRQEAVRLGRSGGTGAGALAALLDGVASAPASQRAAAATQAIRQAGVLYSDGAITSSQYGAALALLQLAGGSAPSTAPTTSPASTTTVSPPSTATPATTAAPPSSVAPPTTAPAPTSPPTSPTGSSGATGLSGASGPGAAAPSPPTTSKTPAGG